MLRLHARATRGGYLHAAIEERLGGSFGGLRLEYAVEDSPLGTGGAIRRALAMAREDAVLSAEWRYSP